MDMQTVKELTITEGEVRTIHDASHNQLWGKVAYDTKYKGDTTQQTYTGKNLWNMSSISGMSSSLIITGPSDDGEWTLTWTGGFNAVLSTISGLTSSEEYVLSFMHKGEALSMRKVGTSTALVNTGTDASYTKYFVLISGENSLNLEFIRRTATTGVSADVKNFQIELGSTATDFEPYVGGIPSPNPDYPQTVNVVTGTQTLTLGDGMNSDDYTLSLGSVELCKIGTYQDYIYKGDDGWYVHNEIYKKTLNGTESWESWGTSSQTNTRPARLPSTDISPLIVNITNSQNGMLICNIFTDGTQGYLYSNDIEGIATTNSNLYIKINKTTIGGTGTVDDFKNWLSTNNPIVYYVLATSTNTKITDTTLISELEAIDEWMARYGYTSVVSGNLPIIVDRTAL